MKDLVNRDDVLMCLTGDITGMTIEDYIKMVEERVKALPNAKPGAEDCWGCNCPKMERLTLFTDCSLKRGGKR